MRLDLAYLGHSQVHRAADGLALDFAPNLARPAVFFDGALADPLRFREAISALHDVVVGDFRFKKRDKTAYREYLQQQRLEEQAHRSRAEKAAKAGAMGMMPGGPPPDLEAQFRKQHQKYWSARISLANRLAREDPALFRALVPCDPVVTVAPDVVLFEGFAKDESSYGCLSLDRNSLVGGQQQSLGTTNVDYSMALYEQFQTLRSYRPTRLKVDPKGFEVAVQGAEDYREEKIDLPPSWLRAFGQVQAAMTLPARTVPLDIATIYGALSFLKRHKEKSGPRSLRLELTPQKPPELVLEPWNHRLVSEGTRYQGPRPETIKLWGRRRLMVLARLLPLAERIEVRVLGSGLPHVWLVHMGALRFTLGLSGWTSNDWSSGAALELLRGTQDCPESVVQKVELKLSEDRALTTSALSQSLLLDPKQVDAALFQLARRGQVIYDFGAQVSRYRPILPTALSEQLLGPEHPELSGARSLRANVRIKSRVALAGLVLITGMVGTQEVELGLDPDGTIKKGRCDCSYFFRNKLRQGPCRHLLALKLEATKTEATV